jgi:hypothetical protein
MTPLTPLAPKRSGAIRVPHSISAATQRCALFSPEPERRVRKINVSR